MTHHPNRNAPARPRRADAERSIARIVEATIECLSRDPEASMAAIAQQAGVVRATIYVHFPTRESLIEAVTRHVVAEVAQVIAAAEPDRGDAVEALRRVVSAAWRTLGRHHALVAINMRLPQNELHGHHGSVLAQLEPLIERGQREGVFRADIPAAWHLATLLALVHSASAELTAGRIGEDGVEDALTVSVVGALTAEPASRHPRGRRADTR